MVESRLIIPESQLCWLKSDQNRTLQALRMNHDLLFLVRFLFHNILEVLSSDRKLGLTLLTYWLNQELQASGLNQELQVSGLNQELQVSGLNQEVLGFGEKVPDLVRSDLK
jgi:hypothetical protein